jgi:hypothetical protein
MITDTTRIRRFGSMLRAGTMAVAPSLAIAILAASAHAAPSSAPPDGASLARAGLEGRTLSVAVRCERSITARLDSPAGPSRRTDISCRDGRGRGRFLLNSAEARRAASTPGLTVELVLRDGGEDARTQLEFKRPSKPGRGKPGARSAGFPYMWHNAYATCQSMPEYGYKAVDFFTNNDFFRLSPGTPLWWLPKIWAYNADGSQYWVYGKWQFNASAVSGPIGTQSLPLNGRNFAARPAIEVYRVDDQWVKVLGGNAYTGSSNLCYFG